jgi:hypothetical protein
MMKISIGTLKVVSALLISGLIVFLIQSGRGVAMAERGLVWGDILLEHVFGSSVAVPFHGQPNIRFAVIGDYGDHTEKIGTQAVAEMVKGWHPDFIITLGDNNYDTGEAKTLDQNVGQYYSEFIYPYQGAYPSGAAPNRFFPIPGNHDWGTGSIQPYLDYFPIDTSAPNTGSSNNERYYDFIQGPVHFFALDSDAHEPDGYTASSLQASWLQEQLTDSSMPWQLVYLHHAPFSSGTQHGSSESRQWPFAAWGADAVLAGHEHTYERLLENGIPYFVNGLGGRYVRGFADPVPGSLVRYGDDYGAMLVEATPTKITFSFYAVANGGTLIDQYSISK